jgi:hypothetical protein
VSPLLGCAVNTVSSMSSRSLSACEARRWAISHAAVVVTGQPGASPALDPVRETAHSRGGQFPAFAAGQCCLGGTDVREDFCPPAFAFLPQCERFADGFFFRAQPADRDRVAHECLLIRREAYIHDFQPKDCWRGCQPARKARSKPVSPNIRIVRRTLETDRALVVARYLRLANPKRERDPQAMMRAPESRGLNDVYVLAAPFEGAML